MKRFIIVTIIALFAVATVFAQSEDDLKAIDQAAKSDFRDQKEFALKQIGKSIDNGTADDKLREILEYLALEGTQNKTNARLNFPDVRRQAVRCLGKMKTVEAKNTLLKVCRSENESMVLTDAIIALGIIGMNDDNDVVSMLIHVGNKNNASLALDNSVAYAIVDTFEKLAEKHKTVDGETIQLLAKMLEGQYSPSVKQKTRKAIDNMRRYVNG